MDVDNIMFICSLMLFNPLPSTMHENTPFYYLPQRPRKYLDPDSFWPNWHVVNKDHNRHGRNG